MRTVNVSELTKSIKEMCIEANHYLSKDMETTLKCARETEASPLGKQILNQLSENLKIAADDMIPICQDTGMAVVFLEIGQDVHLEGGSVEDAVNEGVRLGYTEGFLRKSVVRDPIERVNSGCYSLPYCSGRKGQNYSGSKRIWKREYESRLHAKACGRYRRC